MNFEEICASITKEEFEIMSMLHMQVYHNYTILMTDINLIGLVKYFEGYNYDTYKKALIVIASEDEIDGRLLEAMEPGYDSYHVYVYGEDMVYSLLNWLCDEMEYCPKCLERIKENLGDIFCEREEIFL